MAIAASVNPEQDDSSALLARIRLLLSDIDLANDMSESVESAIAFGELGDGVADDEGKKLMILWDRGDISDAEFAQFVVAKVKHVEG